jgi:hypothetical protein
MNLIYSRSKTNNDAAELMLEESKGWKDYILHEYLHRCMEIKYRNLRELNFCLQLSHSVVSY